MKRKVRVGTQNYFNKDITPCTLGFEITVEFPWWKVFNFKKNKIVIEKCAVVVVAKKIATLDQDADILVEVLRTITDINNEFRCWGLQDNGYFVTQIKVNHLSKSMGTETSYDLQFPHIKH